MRCSRIIYTTLILLLLVFDAGADDARPWIDQGKEHFQAGRWEGAAMAWEKALERLDPEKDAGVYLDLVVHLANAWQSLGYYGKAFSLLREAAPVVEKKGGRRRYVQFLGGLGDLHLATGDVAGASKYLGKAVEEARLADNPRLLASALCDLGNLFASDRDYAGAISTYAEAVENARWAEDHGLEAEILINARHAAVQGDYPNEDVDLVMDLMERLPDSHEKAWNLIRLGLVASETRRRLSEEEKTVLENKLLHSAYNAFEKARRIAEGLGDWRTISHALGGMGRLYEEEKRWSEALALTRRAVFVARQGDYPQLLYKWQWRIGKISAALGAEKEAERAYRNAVSTLNSIRTELFTGWRDGRNRFDEEIRPVYLELTDLLLKRARAAGDADARQGRLREARDVMEMLKTAELENYFDDECATMMDDRAASLDRAPPGVAVIYPIVFPQKIVLLLTLDDGVTHVETPVEAAAVKETALRLRHGLQHRMNNRFLYDAERLYDWIIRPIESTLAGRGVHTLVFAPDGALRLIPMSTLHDGKQFLVEKYALAVIPAITLLDPRPLDVENTRILLAGLSEARQGFSPLPSVPDELKDIRTIMDGQRIMMNESLDVSGLTDEFKANEYSIFHMATHGVFGGTPEESFLLTYDGRLTMNGLEKLIDIGRFRENPVELLTLSACQTALGNERAALGLAGVAVKAGVRSALATLWYVDDEATSLAVREFYRQLKTPGISKAKALQNAQVKLIKQSRYWKPIYWAPFLLIGNWM